jgi:hypothetical protein
MQAKLKFLQARVVQTDAFLIPAIFRLQTQLLSKDSRPDIKDEKRKSENIRPAPSLHNERLIHATNTRYIKTAGVKAQYLSKLTTSASHIDPMPYHLIINVRTASGKIGIKYRCVE